MHPDSTFRDDPAEALARVGSIGFAHLFAATPAGPLVAHVVATRHGAALRFHLSRANRLTAHLDGAAVLLSVAGVDGYVSPDWYTAPGDQVPTWNYVAVEVDGRTRALTEAELVDQLDALAAAHEPRVNPANPWTRAKMDDALFRRMLNGILGFEVTVTAVRATTKLSQNKPARDRAGVVAGLLASGNAALAAAMGDAA